MNLLLLVHVEADSLLVVDSADLLKYVAEYRVIQSLCLYSPKEVCKAFAEFFDKGVQQRLCGM